MGTMATVPGLLSAYHEKRTDHRQSMFSAFESMSSSGLEKAFLLASAPIRYPLIKPAKSALKLLWQDSQSAFKGEQSFLKTAGKVIALGPRLLGHVGYDLTRDVLRDTRKLNGHINALSRGVETVINDLKGSSPDMQKKLLALPFIEAAGGLQFAKDFTDEHARALKNKIPKGNGEPVYMVRGFTAWPGYMEPLAKALRGHGYDVTIETTSTHDMGGPFNSGTSLEKLHRMVEDVKNIHERTGKKVNLVGYSHGGMMSKLIAHEAPEHVESILSLVGLVNSDANLFRNKANLLRCRIERAFDCSSLSEGDVDTIADIVKNFSYRHPDIPVTRIGSNLDGFVSFNTATGAETHAHTKNIKIDVSHIAAPFAPTVHNAILATLSETPFMMVDNKVHLGTHAPAANDTMKPELSKAPPKIRTVC